MSDRRRTLRIDSSAGSRSWPVLLLLLAVVLVPTICVLWFMNEVTQNEHLAVRKKLTDVYRSHLPLLREHLQSRFFESIETVDRHPADAAGAVVFHDTVCAGLADSLICYDAQAQQIYPQVGLASTEEDDTSGSFWKEASRLEHIQKDFSAAANAYATIERDALAEQPPAVNVAARAMQSQARCYFRAGQSDKAIRILDESLGEAQFFEAIDLEGRLIVADAELRALELLHETPGTSFATIADRLRRRLSDYTDGRIVRFSAALSDESAAVVGSRPRRLSHAARPKSWRNKFSTSDRRRPRAIVLQTTGVPNVLANRDAQVAGRCCCSRRVV